MEEIENLCQTCFSTGRRLHSTSKIDSILREIKCKELSNINICWECHSIVMRFHRFKLQVTHAQSILGKKIHQKPYSNLKSSTKNYFDFEFTHNNDPLTNDEVDEKDVPKLIKQEYVTDIVDNPLFNDEYNDQKEVIIDVLKKSKMAKRKRCIEKDVKKNRELEEELKEKFDTITFTEEEMLRSREEKRNQPNYKKIPFKCHSCVLGFIKKENLDSHFEKKHRESIGDHVCLVCATRFSTPNSLAKHRTAHYVVYKCSLCCFKTSRMKAAANHSRARHARDTRNTIHCEICATVCRTPEELARHTREKHILYCKDCGEKFKGKHTLRTHQIRIHAVKREFVCDMCTRSFLTKSRLESHMIKHSQSLARKLAYCSLCRVQYKDIQVYRNHVRNSVNHAQNRFPCPECGKKFASKVYWKKHYNFYHLKKSSHKCETCKKLFISEWRLKNHKQKHHGLSRTRDHACNVCGKKFYTLPCLRGHQLTHSSARGYLCEDCGDTFKQRPALYTHARLVHRNNKNKSVT